MQPDPKIRRVPLRLETLDAALEQPLQNEAEALDVLVAAAQRGQDQPELWGKLDAAAVRDDRLAELAFAYERLSRDKKLAKLPPAAQADILGRIGVFFADAFGDPDGAEVYLQQAIGLSPAHPTVFAKLESLLIRKQEGLRVSDLYATAALHKQDKRDQISMLRRALELCEGFGGAEEEERRIKLFHQILRLDPGDPKVRKSLEDAYLRAGKVADLAKMLEQTLHGDGLPAAEALATRERLIELYLERLREPEKTITHTEEVLRAQPSSEAARKAADTLLGHKVLAPRAAAALAIAFEKLGRYAEAAKCLAVEVDHFRGPRRVEAQKKLASLKFQRLGDLPGALSLYEQVVVIDPSDDEVRERYRALSAALDKSADATRVLTRALAAAKEGALRAKIGVEIGEIFVEVGDAKRAKVAFAQVLESGGGEAEVLRATRALAKLATEAKDPRSLANALGRLSGMAPDPEERGRVAAELGRLCEMELGDSAGAIEAWRKVLGTSRDHEALGALSRLYEATGAHRELGQVLDRRADVEADAEGRERVLLQVAELRATKLGDRAGAIEALRRVIATFGATRAATQKLVQLLEQERRWEDLASALEADVALAPAEERAGLRARLGQLRLARLNDLPGAIAAFGAALSADRFDKTARLALEKILGGTAEAKARDSKMPPGAPSEERLAAAVLLEGVYRAEGASAALVRVLEAKVGLVTSAEERLRALDEATAVMERDVGDAKRAFDLAGRGLREAVTHVVGAVPGWLARVTLLGEKGADTQKRAEVLAAALGEREVDEPALGELAKKAGEALVASGDVARALPILRRALAFEPGSPELVNRIDTLLKEQGSPEERVALYRTLLQKSHDQEPERRRELLHAIAAIQRRDLGDVTGAIETYRRILASDPDDGTAQEAVLEAYAEAGQPEALYTELGTRLYKAEGEERARLLVRLADVAQTAGWSQRAAEHYTEALVAGAALLPPRLVAVEQLGLGLGDAKLVRLVLARRVEQATAPEEEALWLERLAQHDGDVLHDRQAAATEWKRAARLVEESGSDEDRARKLYERALSAVPDDREAAARLVHLYDRMSSHWSSLPGAHEVMIRTSATPDEAVTALLAFEPAAIKARAAGAFSSAIATVGKRHGPLSPELWKQVQVALARVLGADVERQDEAAAVYRAMVESAPPDSSRATDAFESFLSGAPDTPARRADKRWLFELRARTTDEGLRGRILVTWAADEERGGDLAMALELTERSLALEPSSEDALAVRCRLLLATGDYERAAEALEARRDRAEGEARTAIERERMTLLFERLGRVSEALDCAARILEAEPTDATALDMAERAMASVEGVVRAAEVLAKASEAVADPEASAAILRRIVGSTAFGAAELADRRAGWVLRLLDCLSERPEDALDVALAGVSASPFEWSLWERAERIARDLSRPDAVAAAYRAAAFGEGASSADLELFEELGRRAVEFHEEWFDEPENVTTLLRRMVQRAPTPGWAFERLKLVYNAGEHWNELFALYDAALAATTDAGLRLQLLDDAAGTAKDLAGDPERLIGYLEEILPLRRDARTRDALERLYERRGRKARLIELLLASLGDLDARAAETQRMRIAQLQLDVGDANAAYETIATVLAAEPEREGAYELLERILRTVPTSEAARASDQFDGMLAPSPLAEDLLSARRRAAALLEKRYRAENRSQDLLRVLSIELSAAGTPSAKIPRLREMVRLRLSALDDEAGALDDVAALLLLEPGENEHKETLVRLSESVGRFDRLAATLAEAAERTSDPRRRAALYGEASAVHRDKIGDIDGAIALTRAILPLAADDRATMLAAASELARLLARTGRQADLCDALERLATLATDPAERRSALAEVARIAANELGDVDRAVRAHEARLAHDATDAGALDDLVALLETTDRFDLLGRALVRRADLADAAPAHREDDATKNTRAALADAAHAAPARHGDTATKTAARADLLRAALLAEEKAGDLAAAVALRERVRSTFGRDADTGDALVRLYERTEQWETLVRILEEEAVADGPPARSGVMLRKLGDLHAEHTGRLSDAIASYTLACEQGDPDAPAALLALIARLHPDVPEDREPLATALDALARTYTARDDWQSLVALAERRITAATSPAAQVTILREAADLWERRGADTTTAFDALLRAFETSPSTALAADVRRLVSLAARHETLAERLPAIVAHAPELPAETVRDLYWDIARAFREQARAVPQSPPHDATQSPPHDLPQSSSHAATQSPAHDLPQSSSHAATQSSAHDLPRSSAHHAAAALAALRRALAADPTSVALHEEICDLLRGTPTRDLIDALLALAALVDPLPPLREAATHAEALGDIALTRAVTERLLREALARFPTPAAAGDAAPPPAGTSASNVPRADQRLPGAASAPVTALPELPAAAIAARAAFHTLIDIARAEGDADRVVSLGEQAAALPFPPADRRAFRIAAAESAGETRAIAIYTALFADDPADRLVAERLFTRHEARGDGDALIAIRGQQIDTLADPHERAALRLDLARRLSDAQRGDAAIQVLRTSLSDFPGDAATVAALAEQLRAESRFADLVTLREEEAARREAFGDTATAAALWTQAATVSEHHLKDILRAIQAYRRAAAFHATEALAALARLYAASGQHGEAARVMETLAAAAPPADRAAILLSLASTLVAAGEPERARRRLEAALTEVPDPAPLRARLRDLYRAAGDVGPLADMMAEDAARSADPAEKMSLLREAAEIHLSRNDPGRAVPLLSDALQLASDDLALRLLWCRALSESGRRDDALASLRALIDAYGGRRPKERALVHHELARVLLAAGDKVRASGELDVALRIDPAHPEILQALAKLSLAEGQLERAHRTFRALLLVARRPRDPGDTLAHPAAPTTPPAAPPNLPPHPASTTPAPTTTGASARASSYPAALTSSTAPSRASSHSEPPALAAGMSRAEILCELSDIAARQGDEARATEYMESAFDAARETPAEGQRLARALAARDRPRDLARALAAEIERASGAEAARLWSELAALHEGPLDLPRDAVNARLAALALAPHVPAMHDLAAAACARTGELARYVAAVSDLIEHSENDNSENDTSAGEGSAGEGSARDGNRDHTVDLLLRLGRALEAEPGDTARAVLVYQRAESLLEDRPLDPRLFDLWKALERCFVRQNEPDLIARLLEKRVRVAAGPERADALYALADLRLATPATHDTGLDLLVEATALDPDLDRAEAALRRAASSTTTSTTAAPSARAPRLLERFAREKSRPRALLAALLLVFENEPLGEDAMREAVDLAGELGDPTLAQDLLRRAVARDDAGEPLDPGLRVWARVTLADLREQAGELAEAAALREAAAPHADAAEERALLLRVARDAAGELADLPRAARIYEALRLREPADREVWEPLADVYRRLADGARLATLIEDTVPLIDSPDERGRLRLERARLVLSQDETRAIDLLQEVLEEDPAQAEAAKLLAGVFEHQGRLEDLSALLRRQLDTAKDREDARAVTDLSLKLGALLERTGDEHGALDVYHHALDWDAQSKEALRAVLRLSVQLDNSVDLGDALEKLLYVEDGDEAAVLAIKLAELRAAHGDTPGAESALEAGFVKCPGSERLLELLAERYVARGAHQKLAAAHVRRSQALPELGDRIDALCRAAEIFREKAADPEGAARVLESALALDPRERDVLLALIDACEALARPERAIAAVTLAIAESPDDSWLHRSRASLHEVAGRFDLAVQDLARAHESGGADYAGEHMSALERAITRVASGAALPGDLPERELRLQLAEHSARAGDLERARTQLSDLLRKDGKDKGALRALAALEDTAGHWDAASAIYRRLLSLEEGDALASAALRLANACERADRFGDARGGLERALRAVPANTAVRERLRHLYDVTSAKPELATLFLEDSRDEPDPARKSALLARAGRLLTEAGDGARAVPLLEEARRLGPDAQDVTIALAHALAASGRGDEARALLAQAAALHRGKRGKPLGAIHLALSRIEQQEGRLGEALQAMLRAFDNDPQNADLAMELGAFALELDDAETAARAFRAVTLLKTVPSGAVDGATARLKALAYHHLATLANVQGDRRKARFMVEKSLAEDPQLEGARALLDSLR